MITDMMVHVKSIFSQGTFAHNVLIMVTGTSIAQAISISITPILTRLFTPADYGIFALYMSAATLVVGFSTGRYDVAVMLPKDDIDAINLLGISAVITIVVSFISAVIIFIWNVDIGKFLGNEEVSKWLYLIPVSVILNGFYQLMYVWTNRSKQFQKLSVGKVGGSLAGASTSLGFGFMGIGSGGLIAGAIANQIAATGILSFQFWKQNINILGVMTRKSMKEQAIRYRKFPFVSLPADYANVLTQQIPAILLTRFFGSAIVGFYSLTQRILSIPIGLIANSVLDVFRQRASDDFRKLGNCRAIFIKTFLSLALLSLLPFSLFFISAPAVFAFILGEPWRTAGEFAQILTPLFFFRFVASPLSYVLYIAEKQKYDLIWQICLFLFSTLSIVIGSLYYDDAYHAILLFSVSYSLMYVVYFFMSFKFSKG